MRNRRIDAMDSHGIFLAADSDHAANMAAENKTKLSFGFWTLLLAALMLAVFPSPGRGQTISATLSGFVYDQAGAVVPHAKIKLTNEASKDHRETISNGSGYFSFTAIPAATYSITVEHAGFALFEENGIVLHPADQLNLTNIKLEIGSVEMTVTVTAAPSTILTSGERSVLITADDIKHLPVEGRDATELIKILPGFSEVAQGAGADNLAPDPSQVGSQISSYSANGSTPEGISIVSDGVNITDPGGEALTDQVINMDNVQEVSVQTSNFGADSAKGPIVINAVGKSGGSEYHGSLYVYGRTYQMNTQDWFSKYDNDPKPQDRYIYPGGNIGGPVKIPGTNLNHNNKLVFFASSEDYAQREVYSYGSAEAATIYALLPTQNMRNGNFSASELSNYFGIPDNGASCNPAAGSALALYVNICNPASGQSVSGTTISNNQIPNKDLDAGAAAIMNNLVPLPNRTPFNNFGNYYNYSKVNLQNNDSFQLHTRVDYAFSDNAKLYVTYGFQHGSSRNPQQIYYSPQQPFGEIDTPDGILGQDFSHAASLNFTQVLSNSLTNEIFAGVNLNLGGNEIGKKGVDLSSTIGYPYQGIYNTVQYPQLDDYGYDGLPLALFPDYSSPIFQHKFIPNGGDNLTKVFKTHTIKTGFYIERTTCNETDLDVASNGQIGQYYVGPNNGPGNLQQPDGTSYPTPGNYLASFFEGEIGQFSQYNLQTNSDLYYWTVDSYVTDSWKYNKKLTLDIGFRLGHVGPWQDAHGLGMAVWKPGLYAQQAAAPVIVNGAVVINSTTVNPGYTWHALDKSIPNSGAGSTLAFFSPRFGLAYDLRGNGKTIIRGGIGAYRSHDAWNDVNQEQATAQGQSYATLGGGGLLLKNIPALAKFANVGAGNGTQGATDGVGFGLTAGDTEQPLTYTYSFGISQQLNSSSLFELNYQGSQSSHLLTQYEQGASGDLENIDALPIGTLYQPDPITGAVVSLHGISPSTMNDFRPYPFYSQVNVARHILYSNYNSLQTSIHKTQGSLTYDVNYTWSKNLGVLGSYGTGNVIDSGNIRPNYGPLAYDRSQVGKGTITYNTGSLVHGGRLIRGLSNNWEVSGIVVIQSGPNAQRVLSSNLGLGGNITLPVADPNGPQQYSVNNITYLGTPDVVLQPALTCDPRSGLAKHQYINVNCFRLPQFGENGPAEFPYIHAPGFFNADARVGKDLQLGGKKSLQFQLSAFNVINRPNNSFSSKFPTEQELLVTGNELNYQGSGSSGYAFPTDFGKANFRFGRRIAEIGIRYNF
ncbi:MAG: carboxypeptidase regulatory-like domain-containing protein [Terracidiphilus sp.]